ncbi:MAG: linear amide C-N hydrolase [Cyanobacteria bacterium SZAS TMP-1]|nr:linear amide C-N hydrolase [Cyanobacteria bacterium SZAS TMP-1]
MRNYWKAITGAALALASLTSLASQAWSCTRAVYLGSEDTVVTTRSMDWQEDMKSNLWLFPRGMKRDGATGKNAIKWTSKYGSLVTACFDFATADGMNEKGLVANILWLSESDYGKPDPSRPGITIAAWNQYALDNYATVAEAVEGLSKEPFQVVTATMPGGRVGAVHLALTDPTGDSAVFEYIKGKLVVHHGRQYTVMTNSPTFDQQLALNTYWERIGGLTFLPGTINPADRFARAYFYMKNLPQTSDELQSIAQAFSVIRCVSVPLGISVPDLPNVASTLWRTVADQKRKIYYFDSAVSPNAFWVPLADMDFSEGAAVKKLTIVGGKTYSGNASSHFEKAEAFKFLAP